MVPALVSKNFSRQTSFDRNLKNMTMKKGKKKQENV